MNLKDLAANTSSLIEEAKGQNDKKKQNIKAFLAVG